MCVCVCLWCVYVYVWDLHKPLWQLTLHFMTDLDMRMSNASFKLATLANPCTGTWGTCPKKINGTHEASLLIPG